MSLDILGEGFDLHGGGTDLVFPHHENERAQANAAGHEFARHWMHSGMVTIGGEKMAKSVGNFLMLRDALGVVRRARHPSRDAADALPRAVDLGPTELDGASAAVARLDALVRRAAQAGVDADGDAGRRGRGRRVPRRDGRRLQHATRVRRGVRRQPTARTGRSTAAITTKRPPRSSRRSRELASVLGIEVGGVTMNADAEIDALVRERDEARAARDFARADAIRDELAAQGIKLEDSPPRHRLAPMSRRTGPRRVGPGGREVRSLRREGRSDRAPAGRGARAS